MLSDSEARAAQYAVRRLAAWLRVHLHLAVPHRDPDATVQLAILYLDGALSAAARLVPPCQSCAQADGDSGDSGEP